MKPTNPAATINPPAMNSPAPSEALACGVNEGVTVGRAVGRQVGIELGVQLGLAVIVGVALEGRVGLAIAVIVGEGDRDAVGVSVAVGSSVPVGGAGRDVAVTDGVSFPVRVGVSPSSPVTVVGVTASTMSGPMFPGGASSISKYVGPPIMQPAISSAQRAPGKGTM
jgi:hypothetical protein